VSGSDKSYEKAGSFEKGQRILFAPDFAAASFVAGAWAYYFIGEFLSGTGVWYGPVLALPLAGLAIFFAMASWKVWMRKARWVRWLVAAWLMSMVFGFGLRALLARW
jgi:hypothetical protein